MIGLFTAEDFALLGVRTFNVLATTCGLLLYWRMLFEVNQSIPVALRAASAIATTVLWVQVTLILVTWQGRFTSGGLAILGVAFIGAYFSQLMMNKMYRDRDRRRAAHAERETVRVRKILDEQRAA